jgi:hypothetical protein
LPSKGDVKDFPNAGFGCDAMVAVNGTKVPLGRRLIWVAQILQRAATNWLHRKKSHPVSQGGSRI